MKNPKGAGRPSIYKREYATKKIDEYLLLRKDTVEKIVESKNPKTGRTRYALKVKVQLPSVDDYADFLGVSRQDLYNWAKKYPKTLGKGLDRIRNEQQKRLINEGLAGNYQPVIAKLILSSNHGMREKKDITSDDKPITNTFSDEQVDRIAERIAGRKVSSGDTSEQKKSH